MDAIAERYQRFARAEAAGRSALYETMAKHVAESPDALTFLSRLPRDRQQPNLLFAALRLITGTPASVREFDHALEEHANAIAEVMLTRTTQTNEPGRCAALLPVLARIEGPLAVIEVGASAGLCLLPDAYGYDWGRQSLVPPDRSGSAAPVFQCHASEYTPLPVRHPEIVWRAGLDLTPLDVANEDDVAWLETLVWPEHYERLARLRKAVQTARTERPRVVAGDLRQDLQALIADAPGDATVVVFHTAVLSYVTDQGERDAFAAEMIDDARVTWLSNEGPRTFPQFAEAAGPVREDMFLLAVNGKPMAWTGPHGQEIRWI
ncbi:DUF2332 domain-containing protein [Salipiger bermudensis]|uniref:DUF2332 domain-containing protein n=1 Tax=Salipiger bermudensis TaxID=344736 RepID=UPI001CD74F22|nr:DUF2332 domain-containing protein [Salipiger bermudensis]MCA0960562.1 DUF2332 domain-containing protein [Salipiger bermudensis]